MGLRKQISFAFGMVVILFLVALVLAFIFGTIDDRTSIAGRETNNNGQAAAGFFTVSNHDNDFGKIDRDQLGVSEDSGVCTADINGFRDEDELSLGFSDGACSGLGNSYLVSGNGFRGPVFSEDEGFFSVGVTTKADADYISNMQNLPEVSP